MSEQRHLQGTVERITYYSEETGYSVIRLNVEGQRDLVTVVGTADEYYDAVADYFDSDPDDPFEQGMAVKRISRIGFVNHVVCGGSTGKPGAGASGGSTDEATWTREDAVPGDLLGKVRVWLAEPRERRDHEVREFEWGFPERWDPDTGLIDLRPKTSINQIVYTSIGDYLPFPKNILFPLVAKKKKLAASVKSADAVFQWKDVLSSNSPDPPKMELSFDDAAIYQYTGGTTGVSKGVILTHANLSKNVQQVRSWFPSFESGTEIILGALPFFHVFGLTGAMNFAIFMGCGDILVPKPQPCSAGWL